ncbi:MAG: hypothetical protein PHP86_10095 [Nevskiales bacterium]|nr:hypothetical protein [Nevskiales bacterium]
MAASGPAGAETRKLQRAPVGARGSIEVRLRTIEQLFNALDPSPLPERDLDGAAEQFIVGWAAELPRNQPLRLVLHLREWPANIDPGSWVGTAISHYFRDRVEVVSREAGELLRRGRFNLVMGLMFMLACLLIGETTGDYANRGMLANFVYDGLTIMAWVVMWRAIEVFLYDYWHLHRRRVLLRRLGEMPVELRLA